MQVQVPVAIVTMYNNNMAINNRRGTVVPVSYPYRYFPIETKNIYTSKLIQAQQADVAFRLSAPRGLFVIMLVVHSHNQLYFQCNYVYIH
jgi:hypothetical protein